VHGLGGWGDPKNDYRVPDGAFSSSSSFHLSYPSPHTIRRNFTLQPYMNFPLPAFITNPLLEANATFTKAEIEKLTNGFVGDFKGFQTYFEAFNVGFLLYLGLFLLEFETTPRDRMGEYIPSWEGNY
jgi:tyrosinase